MSITPAQAYLQYGWESTFGTETSTYDKAFGRNQEINPSIKNNFIKLRGIGNRNVNAVTPGKFEGTATIDFTLASPWFFRAVLGSAPTDGGGTPYTHTYTESDTLSSFSIDLGMDMSTDSSRVLLGCVVNTCTISCNVGEEVKVSLDILYADETEDATLDSTPTSESFEPYFFQQGILTIGSTVTHLQSITLIINNNAELVYNIGSRKAIEAIAKERDYELKFTTAYNGPTHLDGVYGQDGSPIDDVIPEVSATASLVFTNGLTGSNERTITVNLANIYFEDESLPLRGLDRIDEEITAFAKSCTSIVAEDSTATAL